MSSNPSARIAALEGSDDMLRGFSTSAIPQHIPDGNGHGRGVGIGGAPSQAGTPQPLPGDRQLFPAVVAGRELPGIPLGFSSDTARRRATEDEMEKLVQLITDKISQIVGNGQ